MGIRALTVASSFLRVFLCCLCVSSERSERVGAKQRTRNNISHRDTKGAKRKEVQQGKSKKIFSDFSASLVNEVNGREEDNEEAQKEVTDARRAILQK
jgi:hypothetical protein